MTEWQEQEQKQNQKRIQKRIYTKRIDEVANCMQRPRCVQLVAHGSYFFFKKKSRPRQRRAFRIHDPGFAIVGLLRIVRRYIRGNDFIICVEFLRDLKGRKKRIKVVSLVSFDCTLQMFIRLERQPALWLFSCLFGQILFFKGILLNFCSTDLFFLQKK